MKTTPLHLGAASLTLALAGAATLSGAAVSGAATAAGTAGHARPAAKPFGAACSAVPASGAGSVAGMSLAPVATAASHNPLLSTLATAVKAAGLAGTLNSAKALTVFAPDNAAFAKVPAKTLKALLADKAELTKVLEYHVVAGRLAPSMLAGKHTTLEGSSLNITGTGAKFVVNGTSSVLCGDVQTKNATVYVISSVLLPPPASASKMAS